MMKHRMIANNIECYVDDGNDLETSNYAFQVSKKNNVLKVIRIMIVFLFIFVMATVMVGCSSESSDNNDNTADTSSGYEEFDDSYYDSEDTDSFDQDDEQEDSEDEEQDAETAYEQNKIDKGREAARKVEEQEKNQSPDEQIVIKPHKPERDKSVDEYKTAEEYADANCDAFLKDAYADSLYEESDINGWAIEDIDGKIAWMDAYEYWYANQP